MYRPVPVVQVQPPCEPLPRPDQHLMHDLDSVLALPVAGQGDQVRFCEKPENRVHVGERLRVEIGPLNRAAGIWDLAVTSCAAQEDGPGNFPFAVTQLPVRSLSSLVDRAFYPPRRNVVIHLKLPATPALECREQGM